MLAKVLEGFLPYSVSGRGAKLGLITIKAGPSKDSNDSSNLPLDKLWQLAIDSDCWFIERYIAEKIGNSVLSA